MPTHEPALTIDISALGSLYLVAVAPEALRAASRIVQHQEGGVDALSRAFSTSQAPFHSIGF